MRLHLVCLWRHLLLYGDYLEKVMNGKLVKDISRQTIDKLLSMSCLTLQCSHLGFSLLSGRPKQRTMITTPCTSCFPFQNISKCLLFTSMGTVYVKLFLGACRSNPLKSYFFSLICSFSRTEHPLIKRTICTFRTSQTHQIYFFLKVQVENEDI